MSDGLSEHLSLLASAPDGIKKLRGLILELAVRGKLVSQDPKDEPASKLLKSIAAEKVRLVADGRGGKDKLLAAVSKDEQPFSIPVQWQFVRLGEVLEMINGRAFKPTDWATQGLPIVRIQNLNNVLAPFNYSDPETVADRHLIHDDDLLISWSGTPGTSFGAFIWNRGLAVLNQHIFRCVPIGDAFWSQFLRLAINSQLGVLISKAQGGVGLQHVTKGTLEALPLPLPPLAEQHRIVAKVDEFMALCDRMEAEQADTEAAHATLVQSLLGTLTLSRDAAELAANWQRLSQHFDTLFTTESSLDALKQAILQLAVMGKLAPQDSSDEPASKLLKRIAAEKARLLAEGKIRKDKPLPPVGDAEKPFTVPTGWEWVRFERVAISRLGKMLDKAKNRGLLKPYLRNTNVQWWRFDLDDVKELRLDPAELEEYQLLAGDLLICEGGEPGRCAIWQGIIEEMYFQKAIHRARPCGGVMPEYLQICLRVDAVSGALDQYFTGATIKHFSGEKLASYVLSLPPVEEQHRIVAKVDELMVLCDSLKANLAKSRARQARLATTLIESALQAV